MKTAKARFGHGTGRIIVDDCPYCHRSHYHNLPVGEGQRMSECLQGEYVLDFSVTPNNSVHADAGDSAVSTSSLQASADSTSQTVTKRTQRG